MVFIAGRSSLLLEMAALAAGDAGHSPPLPLSAFPCHCQLSPLRS
jgi:hypothetical protein